MNENAINTTLHLHTTHQSERFYAAGYWQRVTVYQSALEHSHTRPDAFAVQDRLRRLTYAELIRAADALADDLAANGVRMGQRVGVWLPSRVESAVALLACSRNGYACCPSLHRDHTVADVVDLMGSVRAAAFIGEIGFGADGSRTNVFEGMQALATVRRLVKLQPVGMSGGEDLLSLKAGGQGQSVAASTDPDRLVYLAFTSGTTGRPKGVMHSDNTLLANAREMAKDWHFGKDTVIYTMSPLSHNLGLGALVSSMAAGAELVVHDLPRDSSVLDRLLATRTSFLFGVPTHAIDLLSELRARGTRTLDHLKGFRISGAPAPQGVVAELIKHGVMPQSGYGMTEACSHHYTLPGDDPQRVIETSGRACGSYEVRIFSADDPDRELPAGEIGQIGGRGASLMLGYFDDQQATEESFNAAGWFMTGDVGRMDKDGYLVITGRKKDLIIRGGHNIYPARIENLAMQHAAVARAAALPVPDARLGERVCLAVMLKPDAAMEAGEMLAHLDAAGLSRYDMPEFYIQLDEIPLTPSGKIFKRALVDDLQSGRIQPHAVRYQAVQA